MKNQSNKKSNSGCSLLLWVFIITVVLALVSSNNNENNRSQKTLSTRNSITKSTISPTPKLLSPTSTKKIIAKATTLPTSTPVPTPIYIIYNSKDINGAPFYTRPNNEPDLLIRSLGNETQIEIIGEIESHNNYDWYPIRDDLGNKGWIQAMYVSDTNHVIIKPFNINKPFSTKTPIPTRKPMPTKTPVPTRRPTSIPFRKTWKCYDVTSIDYNWDNDNKCISNTNEVVYVSDSRAMQLDPYYRPK